MTVPYLNMDDYEGRCRIKCLECGGDLVTIMTTKLMEREHAFTSERVLVIHVEPCQECLRRLQSRLEHVKPDYDSGE